MSTKIDRKSAMRSTLLIEKKSIADRFATADAMLANRPSELQNARSPALAEPFSAESDASIGRSVVRAALDQVHENPLNARHIYNPEVIKELAASIAMRGQLVPATAVIHPTLRGHYLLVDGHYRRKAAAVAGLQEIDLVLRAHEGDIEMYRLSWLLNEERNAQSPLDNAFAWRKLLDKKVVRNEGQIAEMLGVSLPTVNKTLSLLRLPPAVLERMRDHPAKFGVFTGYELTLASKKLPEADLLALVERIVLQDLSSRAVAAFRAKLDSGELPRQKEISRQYKIHRKGEQIGWLKEWDSGKVALEVLVTDPKERAALLTTLRAKFGLVK